MASKSDTRVRKVGFENSKESIEARPSNAGDQKRKSSIYGAREIAKEILSMILREVETIATLEDIRDFVEDTMNSITDLTVNENKSYSMEEYIFIVYIHLESAGMDDFVDQLKEIRGHLMATEEVAKLIVDTVERAIEIYEYEDADTDDAERAAKNVIWKVINSKRMTRRYEGEPEAQIAVEDILDDIIDHLSMRKLRICGFDDGDYDGRMGENLEEAGEEQEEDLPCMDCFEYEGVFKVAENFVDALLNVAVDLTNSRIVQKAEKPVDMTTITQYYVKRKAPEQTDVMLRSFELQIPRIAEFTVENGLEVISGYVATWRYRENWAYCINYLFAQSDDCSDFYTYEVIWSLPTQVYPVAQATASVYFTIDVSRVKPSHCLVDISYKFEGNSYVHELFKHPFQEQWLLKILDSKIALFRTVTF